MPVLATLPSVVTLSPHTASSMSPSPTPAKDPGGQILTRARLQDLVREIDPSEQLDEEVSSFSLMKCLGIHFFQG